MKKISVIIPVYNNQQTLLELYQKLVKVFAKIKQNYQIIFIDDGSKDQRPGGAPGNRTTKSLKGSETKEAAPRESA